MTNSEIFNYVKLLGIEIAKEQSLPLKEINRITKRGKNVGLCHRDGRVEIYIPPYMEMIERVKIQESMRTICHELAHLRFFNHESEFWKYNKSLTELASTKVGFLIPAERSIRA